MGTREEDLRGFGTCGRHEDACPYLPHSRLPVGRKSRRVQYDGW